MTATCLHCQTPTSGPNLCTRCTRTLLVALAHVADYHRDLDTVAGRQTRYGGPSGASTSTIGKTMRLPVDERFAVGGKAGILRDQVRVTLVGWCRIVLAEHPEATRVGPAHRRCQHPSCTQIREHHGPAADTVTAMCEFLARRVRALANAPWVDQLLGELLDAERDLRRVIDRPADRWYAGICSVPRLRWDETRGEVVTDGGDCDVDLYAVEGSSTITCPGCGVTHDVADRREILLTHAQDELVTATTAAAALVQWAGLDAEQTKVMHRIRKWVEAKRLYPRGTKPVAGRDRPLYRLGDVRSLLEEHARHTRKAG